MNMRKESTKFMAHLRRFIDPTQEDEISSMLLVGRSKADIFRDVSSGKGNGKQHASGKREGLLKDS